MRTFIEIRFPIAASVKRRGVFSTIDGESPSILPIPPDSDCRPPVLLLACPATPIYSLLR
jgi:hypothetical protein